GTKMFSPNYDSTEEILLEDDERDSIEFKILMAYAQRRLPVNKYRKLLKNEANKDDFCTSRRKVKIDHQGDKYVLSHGAVLQGPQHSKEQSEMRCLPGCRLAVRQGTAEQKTPSMLQLPGSRMARSSIHAAQPKIVSQGKTQQQTSETVDVNHIADKLAKLATSKCQESPSDVSFKEKYDAPRQKQDNSNLTDGSKDEECEKEKIIQTIVSLLRESGDKLEEKMKMNRDLQQCFEDMMSYNFFERITDLFLEDVSADSTSKPGGRVQCTKVALTMEAVTRLSAVDNHPMNLVLGFGLKYLKEHFKPWIQDQGGWEKALTSLDQEEIE
ncbi:B2L14 protein, partial [Halcyon senegalensis]|nr:B2L14 protein [Halcyon senegalensis]